MKTDFFLYKFPYFDLGDVILRELRISDAPDYLEYMNHKKMLKFLTQDNRPNNLEESMSEMKYWGGLFRNRSSVYWAIALKENDRLIGTAGFNSMSFLHSRADISYDLSPNFWGCGLMLKSIKQILKFADNELGIMRVQATVITDNERSIKLLERCGFDNEGLLREYEFVDGERKDYYMYGRIVE